MSDQPRVLVVSPDADFSGEVNERLARAGIDVVGRVATLEGDARLPADIVVVDGRTADSAGARGLERRGGPPRCRRRRGRRSRRGASRRRRRAPMREPDASSDEVEEPLTPRERDVLELVALGLSNHAIAARLGISDHTVKFHLASIFGKLDVTTRTGAVRRGLTRGLITV